MKATRESNSKETVSNEKDSSLKQFLFLSSSSPLPPSFSLSSSPPSGFVFFFSSRSFRLIFGRNWSTVYMEMNPPFCCNSTRNFVSTSQINVGEKYKKSGCKDYLAALWIFLFLFSNNFKSIKPLESVFSGHMAGAADKSCSDKHPLCW